jgi:hypothetical protein
VIRVLLAMAVVCLAAAMCRAQERVIDSFDSTEPWTVLPSDGVKASLSIVEGTEGKALRLQYDFEAGAGFVVIRRAVPAALRTGPGEHFRFTFQVRGTGPKNNLEFKLVDPSGDNVWWLNQRAYEWPTAWKQERIPNRKISFAWGPVGAGQPNPRPGPLGFVEFAIAASEGGRGSVDFDTLTFEPLAPPEPVMHDPTVILRTSREYQIDFKQVREFGGLALHWDPREFPASYMVQVSSDEQRFSTIASVTDARGGLRFVQLPDAQARFVRLLTESGHTPKLERVEVLPVEFGASKNGMLKEIARRSTKGLLPRYFHDEQSYWTVVGIPNDRDEALLSADGAVEVGTSGFTIEPFLATPKGLITWADVKANHRLEEGYLPIPTLTWDAGDTRLDIQCFADGDPGAATAVCRYRIENRSNRASRGTLVLAVRPFQVLTPWQELNITGGVSPIRSIALSEGWVKINGETRVRPISRHDGFGATPFAAGEIVERWSQGTPPEAQAVEDPSGLASGALTFDYALEPGKTVTFDVEALLRSSAQPRQQSPPVEDRLRAAAASWRSSLNKVRLALPASAGRLVDTFRTTQAYILINQDGPAIQPGSRTYERSWMRDGSMTGATLLQTGHPEEMKRFVEWISTYQYPTGKVPCVVDRRGPDPVPEHDSHGQLIYAIWTTYLYTRDKEFLGRHWPQIAAAVDYIDSLRALRLTDEYRDGPAAKRAMYGLVPESISHEGYSAKPMHSYWDSFFVVKGLKDAHAAAVELGRAEDAARIHKLLGEYRSSLYASIELAMKNKAIDYIPGCVELGDFDATSTAIALYPCGELSFMPSAATNRTFDKYFTFFKDRRDGTREWKDYTPYEIRVAGTFIRLGQPDRAHALLDFFFDHQRPKGWNHWAEVVWRKPEDPRFIGDMPHTWVGSEFLQVVRSMFVYEQDDTLVLGAGLRPEWPWEQAGVSVGSFPTPFGALTCSWTGRGDTLVVRVGDGLEPAPLRCVLVLPPGARAATINGREARIESLVWSPETRCVWFDGSKSEIEIQIDR